MWDVAEELLCLGANPLFPNNKGKTAWNIYSKRNFNDEVPEQLGNLMYPWIKAMYEPDLNVKHEKVVNFEGKNVIKDIKAVRDDNIELIKTVDLPEVFNFILRKGIMTACKYDSFNCIQYFVDYINSNNLNIEFINILIREKSPIYVAIDNNSILSLKVLLSYWFTVFLSKNSYKIFQDVHNRFDIHSITHKIGQYFVDYGTSDMITILVNMFNNDIDRFGNMILGRPVSTEEAFNSLPLKIRRGLLPTLFKIYK